MPTALRRLVLLFCVAASWPFAPARADVVTEVETLFRTGDVPTALQRADATIAADPRNARMRFLKGVMLSESHRDAEAQVVFERLSEEFPELPEPYNNLAVIHASRGEWHKARQALETALRVDPAYATAYMNLGDVYLHLAQQAYEQARGKISDATLERKLTLVRELLAARPTPQTNP
jgi:Flp pilus assembly protein TadD